MQNLDLNNCLDRIRQLSRIAISQDDLDWLGQLDNILVDLPRTPIIDKLQLAIFNLRHGLVFRGEVWMNQTHGQLLLPTCLEVYFEDDDEDYNDVEQKPDACTRRRLTDIWDEQYDATQ